MEEEVEDKGSMDKGNNRGMDKGITYFMINEK